MISTIVNNYQLSTVSKNLFSAQFEKKTTKKSDRKFVVIKIRHLGGMIKS